MRGGDVSRRLVWLDPAYAERTKKVLSASEGVSEFLCARQIKTCRLAGRELHSTNDSS